MSPLEKHKKQIDANINKALSNAIFASIDVGHMFLWPLRSTLYKISNAFVVTNDYNDIK